MSPSLIKLIDFVLSYGVILGGLLSSFWIILKVPFLRKIVTLFINEFIDKYKKEQKLYTDKKVKEVSEEVEAVKTRLHDIEHEVIKLTEKQNGDNKDIQSLTENVKRLENILMGVK